MRQNALRLYRERILMVLDPIPLWLFFIGVLAVSFALVITLIVIPVSQKPLHDPQNLMERGPKSNELP